MLLKRHPRPYLERCALKATIGGGAHGQVAGAEGVRKALPERGTRAPESYPRKCSFLARQVAVTVNGASRDDSGDVTTVRVPGGDPRPGTWPVRDDGRKMSLFVPLPPPRKQHVVSQVLLRRFAVDGDIEVLAMDYPHSGWRRHSPAAVGYVKDFVRANAEEVEQVWAEVESRLARAFADVDRGSSVKPRGATEEALRDCLALHWARSRRVRDTVGRAWNDVRARSQADLATRPELLDRSFLQLTGLHPAGPQARAIANDRLHEGPDDIRSGRHFADRVVEFFVHAQDKLASSHIAVYDIPDEAEDLLLSDSPVVAPNREHTGWGPGEVALGDAIAFAMPIGPRTAVSAHPTPTRHTITIEEALELNQMQRQVVVSHLYRRPR
ncbi:MAG: hypothetical protein DI630_29370 [Gordonia sp. (in: high G+C Gram-positive bacteria)]|nr:MAG: hypothetical protein DI630_29370 [Gordonia sp. (in: high G+C Gram-positive bacteria)]